MLKIIAICAAAGFVVCLPSLMPAALSQVETGARTRTPGVGIKGDRLGIGTRGGACSQRAWPYYDSDCLYDGMRAAGEVQKVRLILTDRLSIAE
jgi:hypothetical protein